MYTSHRCFVFGMVLCVLMPASMARSQEDPFGQDSQPAPKPQANGASTEKPATADPAPEAGPAPKSEPAKPTTAAPQKPAPTAAGAKSPAKTNKPADKPAEPVEPVLETNPAVRAALEMPRKEPRDYFQAITLLIELGRPKLAKPILADLTKMQVTDAQRVALVNEFGSQGMLHLARTTELAPEGATFADLCMAAAAAAANNPQRIAALVKQLTDSLAEARATARNDLASTGMVGAVATLEAFAREPDPQRRAVLARAIELMHPLVNKPLIAMLTTGDPNVRAEVATILQRLAVPQAAPLLPLDSTAAEQGLRTAIKNYQHGTPPFAVDADNLIELWNWDDAHKKLSAIRVSADKAQVIWIARLATELAHLHPDDFAAGKQALVLRLEAAGLSGDKAALPATANLAQGEPRLLNEGLADALKNNYSHAALALVNAIAEQKDVAALASVNGNASPLAAALDSPSRRVRFAALQTIMALNPNASYPGSSRVPDAIMWFAGSTGERQAVVAMPTVAAAGSLAGTLAASGLAAQATNRARDAVDMAREMPDLEMILIDMNTIIPDIRQALYELRISPTTGDIPIALMAADGRLEDAKRLAAEHTLVYAVPRPHTPEAVKSIVDNLTRLAERDAVPAKERAAEAEQAKKWLAGLRSGNHSFYTFRRTVVLDVPPATRPALPTTLPATAPAAVPAGEILPSP